MARRLFCALSVLWFAGFCVAQSRDRVEIFGGYSYMNPDFTATASSGVSGWDVSATVNVVRHAGIVADFSGFSPTGPACNCGAAFASFHTFMGGPQASISFGKIKPFAHFLVAQPRVASPTRILNLAVISATSPLAPVEESTLGSIAGWQFAVRQTGCTSALRATWLGFPWD